MINLLVSQYRQRVLLTPRLKVIFLGSSSAALAKILTAGLTLISLPLTIRYLGPERYGVWVTIITTTTWIAVLEFGITDTLINTIAATRATGDNDTAARHTASAVMITFSFACALIGLGAVAWPYMNWVAFFNVDPSVNPSEVSNTMVVACLLIVFAPLSTIGSRLLLGYQQAHIVSLVTACGAVLSLIGLITGVDLRFTMPLLFLCTAGFGTLSGIGTLLWIVLISKPWLRPRVDYLDLVLAKQMLAVGAPYFLIRIAGIVVFSTDNLVVSHYLGAAQVTPYSVGMSLVMYAQLIPSFLYPSLWASYAEAAARGDLKWIDKAYTWALRSCVAIICAVTAVLAVFGQWIIGIWAGPSAVPSESLLLAMCVWTIILGLTTMQACLLGAIGRTTAQAAASVIAAALNLGLSIVLIQQIGAIGAVLGTILSYGCIVVSQSREVSRYLQEGRKGGGEGNG